MPSIPSSPGSTKFAILGVGLLALSTPAQLAKNSCKFLGNIITNSVPSDFTTYWNQASPENSGKWSSIQSSVKSTTYNWSGFDVVYKWGKQTGHPVKFHVLVWGQQQPGDAGSATLAHIQRWFNAVHARYPDLQQIDVVNEAYPSHAPAAYRAVLKTAAAAEGIKAGEYDWIFMAFKMARRLWTDSTKTKLIYNDYNTIEYDAENKWQVEMAKQAKAQKIPIDGIGLQAHDAYKLPTASVKAKIDAIAAVGIPLYVTEYDIGETDDTRQKNIMAEQMTMFWNHPSIVGVTYWGLRAGQTWRTGTGIFTSSGVPRPSMNWLIGWIPANNGRCATTSVEARASNRPSVGTRMAMRQSNGRLALGVERDGSFQAMSVLGRH